MRLIIRLLLLAVSLTFVSAMASAAEPQPTAEQIKKWIIDLDASAYSVREAATHQLMRSGISAIEPVEKAVLGGKVEVMLRGVSVLREMAISGDAPTADRAEDSLRKISTKASDGLAMAQASSALTSVGEARQQPALKLVKEAGAEINTIILEFGYHGGEQLTELRIGDGWHGGERELRALRYLIDVQQVTLEGPKVTDAVALGVSEMNWIVSLNVKKTAITEAGFASLVKRKPLYQVSVLYMPLGDSAFAPLETVFKQTAAQGERVSPVRLYGTKLSREGQTALERKLPEVKFDVRRGGFLGVRGAGLAGACDIRDVVAGSPADKAGLHPGDVVTKYGGKEVTDFESLTTLIGEHNVGEKVPVEVDRNGETVKVEVELGEWDVSQSLR